MAREPCDSEFVAQTDLFGVYHTIRPDSPDIPHRYTTTCGMKSWLHDMWAIRYRAMKRGRFVMCKKCERSDPPSGRL